MRNDDRIDDTFRDRLHQRQEIEELISGAGRRPQVPAQDLERIRAQVADHWSASNAPSKRQSASWLLPVAATATVVIAALAIFWPARTSAPTSGPFARVELVSGDVWLAENPDTENPDIGNPNTLDVDAAVTPNVGVGNSAFVLTGPTPTSTGAGRVALRLAGGGLLRVDAGSAVRLSEKNQVDLNRGAIYFDSQDASTPVEIVTRYGVVRDIGTQFEVRIDDSEEGLRVRVREGKVALGVGSAFQTAVSGEELAVDATGATQRTPIPVYGPAWDWVLEVTQVPTLESESLDAFLNWFARETALQLDYHPDNLAERVKEITVYNPVRDMTPFEVLDAVLAGSGLVYEVDGPSLHIARAE